MQMSVYHNRPEQWAGSGMVQSVGLDMVHCSEQSAAFAMVRSAVLRMVQVAAFGTAHCSAQSAAFAMVQSAVFHTVRSAVFDTAHCSAQPAAFAMVPSAVLHMVRAAAFGTVQSVVCEVMTGRDASFGFLERTSYPDPSCPPHSGSHSASRPVPR